MVPALLEFHEPLWIKLERVPGWPYLNDLTAFAPALLGKTLAEFHLATFQDGTCLCHIDNQPANILYNGNSYHFIDFSDSLRDKPERDLTHLLLFWASDLPHLEFTRLAPELLAAYNAILPIQMKHWKDELLHSISIFDDRRRAYHKSFHSIDPREFVANRQWLINPTFA